MTTNKIQKDFVEKTRKGFKIDNYGVDEKCPLYNKLFDDALVLWQTKDITPKNGNPAFTVARIVEILDKGALIRVVPNVYRWEGQTMYIRLSLNQPAALAVGMFPAADWVFHTQEYAYDEISDARAMTTVWWLKFDASADCLRFLLEKTDAASWAIQKFAREHEKTMFEAQNSARVQARLERIESAVREWLFETPITSAAAFLAEIKAKKELVDWNTEYAVTASGALASARIQAIDALTDAQVEAAFIRSHANQVLGDIARYCRNNPARWGCEQTTIHQRENVHFLGVPTNGDDYPVLQRVEIAAQTEVVGGLAISTPQVVSSKVEIAAQSVPVQMFALEVDGLYIVADIAVPTCGARLHRDYMKEAYLGASFREKGGHFKELCAPSNEWLRRNSFDTREEAESFFGNVFCKAFDLCLHHLDHYQGFGFTQGRMQMSQYEHRINSWDLRPFVPVRRTANLDFLQVIEAFGIPAPKTANKVAAEYIELHYVKEAIEKQAQRLLEAQLKSTK